MTNVDKFTTTQLAALDRHLAGYAVAVDQHVEQAASQVLADGPEVATAVLADHLAVQLDEDQLATVGAIMLVRLAQQKIAEDCPCLPGAPKHEHLRGGYSLDAEAKP